MVSSVKEKATIKDKIKEIKKNIYFKLFFEIGEVLVYALMLLAILAMFSGEGEFIYEGF